MCVSKVSFKRKCREIRSSLCWQIPSINSPKFYFCFYHLFLLSLVNSDNFPKHFIISITFHRRCVTILYDNFDKTRDKAVKVILTIVWLFSFTLFQMFLTGWNTTDLTMRKGLKIYLISHISSFTFSIFLPFSAVVIIIMKKKGKTILILWLLLSFLFSSSVIV